MTRNTSPIVVRFGAFGDMVMTLPMLRWLAREYGAPCKVVSSGGWTRPLLETQSCVDHVQLITSRNAPFWLNRSQKELAQWLRQWPDNPVFLCQTGTKPHRLLERGGIQRPRLRSSEDLNEIDGEHWVQRWLRLAGANASPNAVNALLDELGWLDIPDAARQDCDHWIAQRGWNNRPLLLIQSGNKRTMRKGRVDRSSNVKHWPTERWISTIHAMLEMDPDAQILLCGSPEESAVLGELEQQINNQRVTSVADELPISRLLALLAVADGMLSVDTGPAHAAAAVGCPLLVLFGPHDTRRWAPWSWKAPVKIIQGDSVVADIDHSSVIDGWQALRQETAS